VARPKGPPGRARQRVLDAALELFAEHGVSGTSLQMIADRLGLTKAAVYHQFPAKEDIAVAILRDVHTSLEALVLAA
jgi:AcrR family transcriptional regulator